MSLCSVCSGKTSAEGFGFCPKHFPEYKDRLNEPWVKALKTMNQREWRHSVRDIGLLVSLEDLEERVLREEERKAR